jgi:carbonic anhydrase
MAGTRITSFTLLFLAMTAFAQLDDVAPFNYTKHGADWTGECATGKLQSPIEICEPEKAPKAWGELVLDYKVATNYTSGFFGQGYFFNKIEGSFEAQVIGSNNTETFYVYNVDVSSPSEHKIEGEQFQLEFEFQHRTKPANVNDTIHLAGISVLFREGEENEFLAKFIDGTEPIDFTELFGGKKIDDYYAYHGSESSPPCLENVNWYILAEIQEASAAQLEYFKKHWEMDPNFAGGNGNNREIQPTNNRTVYHFHDNFGGMIFASFGLFVLSLFS